MLPIYYIRRVDTICWFYIVLAFFEGGGGYPDPEIPNHSKSGMIVPDLRNPLVRCSRFTNFCWVGKHVDVIMKPTNSPTQGQPNSRKKLGQTWHLGSHFFCPQQIFLRGLGSVIYRKQTTRNSTLLSSP